MMIGFSFLQHDTTISSLGLEFKGGLDASRLNGWLSKILKEKGKDIFRMKGILHIDDQEERFVFQGVHMLFDGKPDRKWGENESKINKIVFIGRNLDRAEIEAGIEKCKV